MKRITKFALMAGAAALTAGAAHADMHGDAHADTRAGDGYGVTETTADRADALAERPDIRADADLGERAALDGRIARDGSASTSLGVTVEQIENATLIGPGDQELGEVEHVLVDEAGSPSAVLVKLEDDLFGEDAKAEIDLVELETREREGILDVFSDGVDLAISHDLAWIEERVEHDRSERTTLGMFN